MSGECDKCGEHALQCACNKCKEFTRICHHISYGDDSQKTFDRYCELAGLKLTDKEKKDLKDHIFDE